MPSSAHDKTDQEIRRIQRALVAIYVKAKKDVSKDLRSWAESVEDRSGPLLQAVRDAKDETEKRIAERAYRQFYTAAVKEKAFVEASRRAENRLYQANVEAARYINGKTAAVYAAHYNETGKALGSALNGYGFKPVSVSDVDKYGEVTKQTVDKKKDTAWNKKNISGAVLAGAVMAWGAEKIAEHAAGSVAGRNRDGANRQASDMLTDAESKGALDSMWRCYDEGFEGLTKEWVCVFDNRTRDTHIDYNDLGPVPLDYEYAPGLARPRDANCDDPAEVCNCRCELVFNTGLADSGTRSAREGEVTDSYKEPSSFEGTSSVSIDQMSYKEWMEWRSK